MKDRVSLEVILTSAEKRELRDGALCRRDLTGMDLTGADWRNARLEDVFLERCDLTGADLRGARFVMCDFDRVVLTRVRLGCNCFDGTLFRRVIGLTDEDGAAIVRAGGFLQPHRSTRS